MSEWPVALRGITESVVTTRGPNERWNAAALGLHAGDPVTAYTWGRTRTRRNFEREGEGYVQFVTDPELFVEAVLAVRESADPVLGGAHAWARVAVERRGSSREGDTERVAWALDPRESAVVDGTVPTVNRGFNAVVEATVAASRLGVPTYDGAVLRARLDYFDDVARRCGGPAERRAADRLRELVDWEPADGNESF